MQCPKCESEVLLGLITCPVCGADLRPSRKVGPGAYSVRGVVQIHGIGEQYSHLLEKAGVENVVELAEHNPDILHIKIVKVNEENRLVYRVPNRDRVASWVEEAKTLTRSSHLPPKAVK